LLSRRKRRQAAQNQRENEKPQPAAQFAENGGLLCCRVGWIHGWLPSSRPSWRLLSLNMQAAFWLAASAHAGRSGSMQMDKKEDFSGLLSIKSGRSEAHNSMKMRENSKPQSKHQ